MKIHALSTGKVSVKHSFLFAATGIRRQLNLFLPDEWSEPLPIHVWAVEHDGKLRELGDVPQDGGFERARDGVNMNACRAVFWRALILRARPAVAGFRNLKRDACHFFNGDHIARHWGVRDRIGGQEFRYGKPGLAQQASRRPRAITFADDFDAHECGP